MTTQRINNHDVTIVKSMSTGQRAAKIVSATRTFYVPVELLSVAAGKDAWMRDILVACKECRTLVKAGDMDCEMCQDCYEKAGEENAASDARCDERAHYLSEV